MDIRESIPKYPISDPINRHLSSLQFAESTRRNNTQPAIKSEGAEAADQSQREPIEAMTARAERGVYPGCVPFGYRNAVTDGSIEVDPLESRIVELIFELCASGEHSAKSISEAVEVQFAALVSDANVRAILQDCFYAGAFEWDGRWYLGAHRTFLRTGVFHRAQALMRRLAAIDSISSSHSTKGTSAS